MGNLSRRFTEIEPPAAAPLKAAKPARLATARKAAAEAEKPATKPRKRSNAVSNTQANAEPAVSLKFDKRAYQRDLMRKRRAAAKTKAKA